MIKLWNKIEDVILAYGETLIFLCFITAVGLIFHKKFEVKVSESPCSVQATNGEVFMHWPTTNHTIHVLKSFPRKDIPALVDAVNDWNDVGIYKIVLVFDYMDGKAGIDGFNTIGLEPKAVTEDEGKNEHTQAVTRPHYIILGRSAILLESDIVLNGSMDFSGIDMRTLLRHELGHFLGLQHKEEISEVMNPVLSRFVVKPLSQWDRDQLQCISGIKYNDAQQTLASSSNNSK